MLKFSDLWCFVIGILLLARLITADRIDENVQTSWEEVIAMFLAHLILTALAALLLQPGINKILSRN